MHVFEPHFSWDLEQQKGNLFQQDVHSGGVRGAAGVPLEQGHLLAEGQQPLRVPVCPRGAAGPLGIPGMRDGAARPPWGRPGGDGSRWQEIPAAPPLPGQSEQEGECLEGGCGRVWQEGPLRDTQAIVPRGCGAEIWMDPLRATLPALPGLIPD